MDLPPIVCPQCSAVYRHPGKSGKTRCAKCGATILVVLKDALPPASQGRAPERRKSVVTNRHPAPISRSARGRGPTGSGEAHGEHAGQRSLRRKTTNPALLYGSLGALALVIVVLLVVLSSSEQPAGERAKPEGGRQTEPLQKHETNLPVPEVATSGKTPQAARKESVSPPSGKPASKSPRKKPTRAKRKTRDPLAGLEKYQHLKPLKPVPGCPQETVAKINKLLEQAMDDTYPAQANRARFALVDQGKNALPLVINRFLKLDLTSTERTLLNQGNALNEVLQEIVHNRRGFNDRDLDARGIRERHLCRWFWYRWWQREGLKWQPPKQGDGG